MNEFELIQVLTRQTPKRRGVLVCGVGDDCAILRGDKKDILISTDAFAEGVHFRRHWGSWQSIGAKCLRAALSDIAAMGGQPKYYWVSLQCSKADVPKVPRLLYRGFHRVAQKAGIVLAGGNLARASEKLSVTLTVWGEVFKNKALRRDGGKPGAVFVTGSLGRGPVPVRRKKIVLPPARWRVGQWLLKSGCVSAMIDVSDGLLADLSHIAILSGLDIAVQGAKIPKARGATLQEALTGGEDYELAFVVPQNKLKKFADLKPAIPVTCIGNAKRGKGRVSVDRPITQRGFDHYV